MCFHIAVVKYVIKTTSQYQGWNWAIIDKIIQAFLLEVDFIKAF